MTPPDWLNDKTVQVYAAEHLPVVRVEDGKIFRINWGHGHQIWQLMPDDISEWPELRAAWEIIKPNDRSSPKDGFYYLTRCAQCSLPDTTPHTDHGGMPPELIPCEDVTEDYIKHEHTFYLDICRHTLIFHLPERECDNCNGEGFCENGDECPDCMTECTLPERIHVEAKQAKEDGE